MTGSVCHRPHSVPVLEKLSDDRQTSEARFVRMDPTWLNLCGVPGLLVSLTFSDFILVVLMIQTGEAANR